MFVESSQPKGANKKHFCFYCKKLQTKIARHLELVHSIEKEVKGFTYLPKGNPERKKLIDAIRKKGDYLFNTDRGFNTTELIVCRRPSILRKRNATDFICCASCKGYFTKNNIRHHAATCLHQQNKRCVNILGKKVSGRIHSDASNILRNKIFPILRDDEVTRIIRYDGLVILYANKMSIKYRYDYQEDMIRARLRLMGRFLITLKKIQPAITDFLSLYDPCFYDNCISAVRVVTRYNEENNTFGAPSVASGLGTLLKQVGNIFISDCIKKYKLEEKFLKLLSEDYITSINKGVEETMTKNRRQKEILLPNLKDIQILHEYLLKERTSNYEKLQRSFSYSTWLNLAKSTLLSILLFNRRRPGELEHVLIEDYERYESLNENNYPDLFATLTNEMKILAQKYVRFAIRGKLGRSVPVLLSANLVQCIQIILNYRKHAKVPEKNPYIFGLPSTVSNRYKYLRACDLMRDYSSACGTRVPHSLRSTQLRKHIATQCGILDISESQTLLLADHMGHDIAIHKKHYRQACLNKEILQLSKLLEKASGNDVEDNNIDEENREQDNTPINESTNEPANESTNEPTDEQNENDSSNFDSENESEYESRNPPFHIHIYIYIYI
ncbi:hypothetical protein ALC62_00571 [Cyphomyrmex costatus]|uniref:Uncharacterized protein n=1 Tax=Cyphomyrmex costatus TaxID=456900 RepID=A0A151IQK1_9HYME|nr:hypothetical protein ALC62_00571 [Cyphomyrmex costatus]